MDDLSRQQLAAMFAATPVALLVFDTDLTMITANTRYLDAVGMDLEAIRGRNVFDVFGDDPSDRNRTQVDSLRSVMRAAVDRRETQVLSEYRYDIPDGRGGFEQRIWNVTEVPVLSTVGDVDLVVHYTEDVTELVQAREQRQRSAALADALKDDLVALNAQLRLTGARDRSIAETLQHALLTELPETPGLRLRAGYRPAADQVGGDWYDAITMPNGATTVMIGDVVGHDMQAAAAMGQLRNMLRALAWAQQSTPSAVLAQLDRAISDLGVDTLATAALATVEPPESGDELDVVFTNAGHPPPVLVTADGQVDLLEPESHDVLLGVDPESPRHDHSIALEPGAQLMLYTDGLIETRGRRIDDGLQRLTEVVARHHDAPDRVDRIIEEMSGRAPEDDVALLMIENPLP